VPERVRAAMVGFRASWWMGYPIGLLAGLAGFIQRGYKRMFTISLQAMGVAVGFTLLFGLCGLLYGYLQTMNFDSSAVQSWYIPPHLSNPRAFLCAGYMHNAAYLGGVLSIPVVWTYQIFRRIKERSTGGSNLSAA